MKKLFMYFTVVFLMFLRIAANAQNSEMYTSGIIIDKTTLPYPASSEHEVTETCNGSCTRPKEAIGLQALYISTKKQVIVNGTDINGDVEIWDVNGNTIATQPSEPFKTILTVESLKSGCYYVNYCNGKVSQGLKLVVR